MTPLNMALVGALAVAAAALVAYRRRRARAAPTAPAAPTAAPDQVALETSATLAPTAADPFAAHVAEPVEADAAVEVAPPAAPDPFAAHVAEPVEADDPFAAHVAEPVETEGPEPAAAEEIDQISWVEPPDAGPEPAVEPAGDAAAPEAAELPEVITEPGWYLPGEADVTWATVEGETPPPAEAPALDAWSPGEEPAPPEAEAEAEIAVAAAEEIPALDPVEDFDPTVGWGGAPDLAVADVEPSPYADLSLDAGDAALPDLSLGDGLDEPGPDELALAPDADDAPGREDWLGEPEPAASPSQVTAAAKGPVTIVVDPLSGWMPAGPPDADGPDGRDGWELVVKLELRPLAGTDEPG